MKSLWLSMLVVVALGPVSVTHSPKTQDFSRLLLAEKPDSRYGEQLMLFGQFVGEWEFEGMGYDTNGKRVTDKGEIHFAWVLQGRAIQDLWIERETSDSRPKVYGSTMRFYDPGIDAWRITWMEPGYGVVTSLIGRRSGVDIVLEGKDATGKLIRWIFSKIAPGSFHWRGERLVGETWQIYEELSARRKG